MPPKKRQCQQQGGHNKRQKTSSSPHIDPTQYTSLGLPLKCLFKLANGSKCNQSFEEYSTLRPYNAHIKQIHEKQPHTCPWVTKNACTKSCTKSSDLACHMRIHTGEKPFSCDFNGCEWSFIEKRNLNRHKQKKHQLQPTSPHSPNPVTQPQEPFHGPNIQSPLLGTPRPSIPPNPSVIPGSPVPPRSPSWLPQGLQQPQSPVLNPNLNPGVAPTYDFPPHLPLQPTPFSPTLGTSPPGYPPLLDPFSSNAFTCQYCQKPCSEDEQWSHELSCRSKGW